MTPDPSTGLYRCAQARIAWIEVLIDRGWHSALERALEEVQANLLSDVRRIHFFDGRSWDEFRAAARVLQPGVCHCEGEQVCLAAFSFSSDRLGRARRQVCESVVTMWSKVHVAENGVNRDTMTLANYLVVNTQNNIWL